MGIRRSTLSSTNHGLLERSTRRRILCILWTVRPVTKMRFRPRRLTNWLPTDFHDLVVDAGDGLYLLSQEPPGANCPLTGPMFYAIIAWLPGWVKSLPGFS